MSRPGKAHWPGLLEGAFTGYIWQVSYNYITNLLNVKKIMEKWGDLNKIVRFSEEKRRKMWGYGVKVAVITAMPTFMKVFKKGIDKKKPKVYIKNIEISTRPH